MPVRITETKIIMQSLLQIVIFQKTGEDVMKLLKDTFRDEFYSIVMVKPLEEG